MSHVVCIAGESGTGKTTSMRNLDPQTTLYIDCDKKGLSWKGWKKDFVPTEFTKPVPDTAKIRKALSSGQALPFASLGERGEHLRIK